jgi:sec-independent protein translocase protein TatA
MIGTVELILIVVILVLLFGAKRIPDLARGIGKGIKEFRKGLEGRDDGEAGSAASKRHRSASADASKKKR